MVREEIQYDFTDYPEHIDTFIKDLMRLMIISKLNTTSTNSGSKEYFTSLINDIEDCTPIIIKYGKSIMYTNYKGMEFADQRVTTSFKRMNQNQILVILESPYREFVKKFDMLSPSSQKKVKWNVKMSSRNTTSLFHLLDSFINAIYYLTSLDSGNPLSLMNKTIGIKNISVTKSSTLIEMSIEDENIILEIISKNSPSQSKIILLLGKSEVSKTIVALMTQ